MPTYQYMCKACDQPYEAVQGFHDAALTTCPACGADELRKVFSSVGVVFKGSGFYRTDSRSGNGSGGSSTSSGSSPSATSSATSDSASTSSSDSGSSATAAPAANESGSSSTSTPAPASSTA